MKCATRKLRSPLKWHGGKSYLARRLIALFPLHRVYVEPFAGGLSVLLNKPKAEVEVASDINHELIDLFVSLQLYPEPFCRFVDEIQYNEHVFDLAKDSGYFGQMDSRFGSAVNFLIRNRFSRGGLGKDFAWSDRLRGGQPGDVNGWETIKAELPGIVERLADVHFKLLSATQVVRAWDSPDALVYCDPPYLHETRTTRKAYDYEMTRGDHEALLHTLLDCRGKVFLSGYRSDLYDRMLAGWKRHEFSMPNHSGQGKKKQRRIECLWEKP